MTAPPRPTLCLVTDRRRLSPAARTVRSELVALEGAIDEAVAAGIDVVQIRERDLETTNLVALVARTVERLGGSATRVLVNDRADVARVAGAGGVHLRSDGPPVARLRQLGPSGWWIGRSVHRLEEVGLHQEATYLLFGTVFQSASKGQGPTQGLSRLADVARISQVPIWAIGGITPETAGECLAAGAAGLAAIGAFLDGGAAPGEVRARVERMRDQVARDFAKLVQ